MKQKHGKALLTGLFPMACSAYVFHISYNHISRDSAAIVKGSWLCPGSGEQERHIFGNSNES